MKTLILLLFISSVAVAQIPREASTMTITEKIIYKYEKTSHGFAVGDWLTIDDSGVFQKGSNPDTQELAGIVSWATNNYFAIVKPGGTVDNLSGLTPGQLYYAQTDGTLGTAVTSLKVGKATSTTTLELVIVTVGYDPPDIPEQGVGISVTAVTSTTATMTVTAGGGTGRLFVVSESPLDGYPVNNTSYTEDPNFGDGDALGSDGHVVENGDVLSVDITGLIPATAYYFYCFDYTQDEETPTLITYNISIGNSTSTNTLADATTPTEKFVVTNVKSKQTSLEISGAGCSCDAIVVVANDSIPVSIDIADGVDPSAGSFGSGTHLGERNYVVYEGSPADFTITGLARDDKIYYKIYERENTGFLYNTNSTVDSAYVSWLYDGGSGAFEEGTGDPPGLTYLIATADVWYNFSALTGSDESNISNGNAGLNDIGPGTSTATVLGSSPQVNTITFNGSHSTARTASGTGIDVNNNGNTWFSRADGFEIHGSVQIPDGINGAASVFTNFCGYVSGSSQVAIRAMYNGAIRAEYRDGVAASNTSMTTSGGTLVDGVNTFTYSVRWDFVNDLVSMWINNTPVSLSLLSGVPLSSQDPTNFNATHDFVVGNQANNGTLVGNTMGGISTAHFAVTPLLTTEQRTAIHEEFNFTASAGAAFTRYDVFEGTGFDYVTSTDSLRLSNGSAGFTDYIKPVEFIPDSLQELDIIVPFKIKSATTSNPSSLFVGLSNATTTESNHGVWGHLNLDNDSGSFGRVQLFSGTGSVGDASWAFRAGSSGGFTPALDSAYEARMRRTIVGNDAFYSFSIMDLYDSVLFSVGYTEPNRPSSAYYGTTMRALIGYQGDTDVAVGELTVVRVGDAQVDTSPPPTPTTGNAYVVATGGDDANDCTEEEPCATIIRGLDRIDELGGSDRTLVLSSGVHTINAGLVLPTNLGLMEGAGVNATFIVATANLNSVFVYPPSGQNVSLIQAVSASAAATTNHLKNFTISGGAYLNRLKAIGVFIRNRTGFQIENVNFEYFNSAAVVIDATNDVSVVNCNFLDGGGSSGSSSGPNLGQDPLTGYPRNNTDKGNYATGAITWSGNIDGFEWIGGNVIATNYGGGYGSKAVGTSIQLHDWHIDGVRFYLHPRTSGSTGGNFAIELHTGLDAAATWGNLEIENCYFENCAISYGVHQDAVDSYTHVVHHCEWFMNNSEAGWCVEVDASNLEFHNNYFRSSGARMWPYSRYHNFRTSNDHHYHNNIYEIGPNPAGSHRYMNNSGGVMNDILIENETINFLSSGGSKWEFWTISASSFAGGVPNASPSTNVVIQDIAFLGDNPGNSNFYNIVAGSGGFTGSILRNCRATHLNVTQAVSGVTNSNNLTNQDGSGWFNLFGPKWDYTSAGYYYPKVGSALIGVGFGGDSPGAVQP